MTAEIKRLNRFTSLPVLLDILENKKLVLLDPSLCWDDKNDTLIIEAYKQKAHIKNLFALCFTHRAETIHHWRTFANGASGCCIQFDAITLFETLNKIKEIRHGVVDYLKISETQPEGISLKQIPFIKRIPYQFEREYRIIWEGDWYLQTFSVRIDLNIIQKITFSQQMPEPVYESIRNLISERYKISKNQINRSTIYENKKWINKFKAKPQ